MKLADVNEVAILIALVAGIIALATVVIVVGSDAIAATGLRDLVILLAGALAGINSPRRQ